MRRRQVMGKTKINAEQYQEITVTIKESIRRDFSRGSIDFSSYTQSLSSFSFWRVVPIKSTILDYTDRRLQRASRIDHPVDNNRLSLHENALDKYLEFQSSTQCISKQITRSISLLFIHLCTSGSLRHRERNIR